MNKKAKNKSFSHYSFFPKNRKGTHVEVIISFVIFIVFVVFIFAASRPSIAKQEDKKNLLDSIEYQILDLVSEDVKVVTIAFPSSTEPCLTLDNSMSGLGIGERIVIKNSSGQVLENTRVRRNGDFISISGLTPQETLFKIYFSNEFSPIASGSSSCASAGEEIGLTKNDSYVFQQKIHTTMNGNYNDLKAGLDVPAEMDFTFGIVLSNGTLIEKSHPDLQSDISTSIYVKDKQIEYIDLNGNINSGYLKIKIW